MTTLRKAQFDAVAGAFSLFPGERAGVRASVISILTALVMSLLSGTTARAQSEESELPPALGEFEAAPLPPPEKPFFISRRAAVAG